MPCRGSTLLSVFNLADLDQRITFFYAFRSLSTELYTNCLDITGLIGSMVLSCLSPPRSSMASNIEHKMNSNSG